MFPIELFGVETTRAKSAGNLGVMFVKNVTFRSHMSAVSSSCFYHIRDLGCICCYLDLDGAKLLATALVSSFLTGCWNHVFAMINLFSWQNCISRSPLSFFRPKPCIPTIFWKCQYFGHIIRGDGIQRLLMEGRINGRRGRGRPRTMWTDNIKEWTKMSYNDCIRVAQDRERWRSMTLQMAHNDDDDALVSSHLDYCNSLLYGIWMVQNYMQLLLCLVISIIAIHFCLVSQTLTSPNFNVFTINWPVLWRGHHHLLTVFHCFVPFIGYL